MPRGMSCCSTIFWRCAANSEVEVGLWWQLVAARTTTNSHGGIRLIVTIITQHLGVFDATNYSCPSSASWLISAAFDERRSQNFRAARADDGHRASPPFGVARSGHGDFEDLAGSAVRGRAAGRERFLL